MNTYSILVSNGYTFELDCQIEAKTAQQARKQWFAKNDMQAWRTIKATKVA